MKQRPTVTSAFRTFAILALLWLGLSGHSHFLLLTLGAFSIVTCLWLCNRHQRVLSRANDGERPVDSPIKPFAAVAYLCWLIVEIVRSNVSVIGAIMAPSKISPALFKVPAEKLDEQGKVIFAQSITLTPGTVTTGFDEEGLEVHGLLPAARDALRTPAKTGMYQRIINLFRPQEK